MSFRQSIVTPSIFAENLRLRFNLFCAVFRLAVIKPFCQNWTFGWVQGCDVQNKISDIGQSIAEESTRQTLGVRVHG
jgi:hypothetical protein